MRLHVIAAQQIAVPVHILQLLIHERSPIKQTERLGETYPVAWRVCCSTESVEEEAEGHALMTSLLQCIARPGVAVRFGAEGLLGSFSPAWAALLNWQRVGD